MIIPIPSYHTTSHTQTKFRTHFPDLIRCPPHSPCVREGDRIVFETGKAIRFFFSTIHIHRHHPKVRIHIPTLRAFTPTNQKIRRGSQVQSHRPTCKHPIRRYRLRTIQGQALGLYSAQDHMPTGSLSPPPPPSTPDVRSGCLPSSSWPFLRRPRSRGRLARQRFPPSLSLPAHLPVATYLGP